MAGGKARSRKPRKPKAARPDRVRAIRTLVHPGTNPGKVWHLDALHLVYLTYLRECAEAMVTARRWTVPLCERQAFFPKAQGLTSQFQKCARAQAVDMVSSWVKSLYPNVMKRKILAAGVLTDDQKRQLFTVGKYLVSVPCLTKHGPVTQEMIDLYWWCVWEPAVTGNRPCPKDDCTMVLSEMVVRLEAAEEAGAFALWLSISTLQPHHRILLPLSPHPELPTREVLARDPGALQRLRLAKTISLRRDPRRRWRVCLVDKRPIPLPVAVPDCKLGIDVGLNVIAATSDGRLFGRNFKLRFDPLYHALCRARAMRHRQGLDRDSPRTRAMEARLRGLVETEVGRVANELLRLYPGFTFVFENMDLQHCAGSKRYPYQRLLDIMLRKAVVEPVNCAYNSQECPRCHHVDRRNRDGIRFLCRNCGYRSHADIVAARNALGRSGDQRITCGTTVEGVLAILRAQYPVLRAGPSAAGRRPTSPAVGPRAHQGCTSIPAAPDAA